MALITPYLIEMKKMSTARKIESPVSCITSKPYHGIVFPGIIEMNRTGKPRPVDEAMSTVLAGGNHHGLVTTESWNSFISYFYGTNQATSTGEPIGTASTKERYALVSYKEPAIEDCYFRMLKPPEIQRAMAFDNDYIVLGSNKDKVKQLGNAVTPPVMEWLVGKGIETLN